MPRLEIERKWLLSERPDLDAHPPERSDRIEQAYVLTSPGEMRVRRTGGVCLLTVKGDGTLSRTEWEAEVPAWVFEQLVGASSAAVVKTRYVVRDGDVRLEVDAYEGRHAGLFTVEAEWSVDVPDDAPEPRGRELVAAVEETARSYVLPAWLGAARDVTDDAAYKNKRLAVDGVPAP